MASRTAPTPQNPPLLSRWRINAILLICVVFALANAHKLFEVQIQRHDQLSGLAQSEFRQNRTIQPARGIIRDSTGSVLAMNVDRDTLGVAPPYIDDDPTDPNESDRLALLLSPLIGKAPSEIKQLLLTKDREYVVLARRLTPEVSEQIRALKNTALTLNPEPVRVYPKGTFAANVVGVANYENVGISGVEGYNNSLLAGVAGSLEAEIDSASNSIWIEPPTVQEPRDGADITLTIDPTAQHIAEEELQNALVNHGASGGSITVMDAKTGAILAMATSTKFDPNRYTEYQPEIYNKNSVITDQYEPGSTFKPINLAIGLQAKAFTVNSVVDDPGFIARAPGCCANFDSNGHSPMTPENVILYSSNVGALQYAEMAGDEAFYQGLHDFGYGEPTGIELGGEEAGIVQWPESTLDWRPIVLSTNGYGQGIAVTPLQHVRAMSALANGGNLMQPYIIQEWCERGECHKVEPKVLRKVIDSDVAMNVAKMMVRAANNNYAFQEKMWWTACNGYYDRQGNGGVPLVPGYNIAAKTGTSSIPDGRGGYENATIGSVMGFGPIEDARFTVLVKLDRTQDIWGTSAIPVYAAVFKRLLTHYQIPPNPELVHECQKAQ